MIVEADAAPRRMEKIAAIDARWMSLALTLGRRGLGRTWPNPAVGAVIVGGGASPLIVGRGITQPGGRPHAETEAIHNAGERARGATLYVTLEPCSHHGKTPPCAEAIIAAGITRVVSAIEDPNPEIAGRGHAMLRAAGIAVDVGTSAEEARRAHAGHFQRIRDGRPHVILKLAVSADGKVAAAGRRPIAISGPEARDYVHLMRAQSDAILIGVGTAVADDPQLTCRLPGMAARSPVRVVLDSTLRLPRAGQLARSARSVPLWLLCGPQVAETRAHALQDMGAEIFRVDGAAGKLDLPSVMKALAARGITRLMVEAGPTIAASLLAAGLVDEAVLIGSDMTIGNTGLDALEGMPLTELTRSPRFRLRDTEALGTDRLEIYERT
jgi:diaminohydroxyphosphoribosylaminopyrimidine deaminase/5-amino-6-(5-phosphoribosylamino)uracil reductase